VSDPVVEARRRKAYMVAHDLGLTRDERLELASYILRRDITTWKGLDDFQISRLLDAMEGAELIRHLIELRTEQGDDARVDEQDDGDAPHSDLVL
jgi:hypothetical protein